MQGTATRHVGRAYGSVMWRLHGLLKRLALGEGAREGRPFSATLPHRADWYVRGVIILGFTLAFACLLTAYSRLSTDLLLIVALGVAAGIAEFFPIRLRYASSITVSVVAYGVAFILLPPPSATTVPLVAGLVHAAHSLQTRVWNLRRLLFNTAQLVITVFLAALTFELLAAAPARPFSSLSDFLALVLGGAVYFLTNTSLVAVASAQVRRLSPAFVWRANYAGLSHYFVGLLSVAAILTVLWQERPLMLPLAAGLAILMRQALYVPHLIEVARTDPKTELYNVHHFYKVFEQELRRAKRFGRQLSVVMADLDYLRIVNNAYGHLAGDALTCGAAEVIRGSIREYDLAARFGGEEFALLLLETSRAEAEEVAERIRSRMAEATFRAPTSQTPIRVTMSLGVASFPSDGDEVEVLVHLADQRMYLAKSCGRNCVASAAGVLGGATPLDDEAADAVD